MFRISLTNWSSEENILFFSYLPNKSSIVLIIFPSMNWPLPLSISRLTNSNRTLPIGMIIPQIGVVLNWRNKTNKSGFYSIHLRITINRDSKYYKVQIPKKVSHKDWSGTDDSWVKPSHPFYFEINNKIIEKKTILTNLIKRSYSFNKSLNFDMIRSAGRKHAKKIPYSPLPPESIQKTTYFSWVWQSHDPGFSQVHADEIEIRRSSLQKIHGGDL